MKTIRNLLQEADPLQVESEPSVETRSLQRQRLLRAAATMPLPATESRSLTPVYLTAILITVVAFVIGLRLWPPFTNGLLAAVRFEVRLAEQNPAPGLKEAKVEGGGKVYLHGEAVVTNSDIAQAEAIPRPGRSDFMVSITFTPSGAQKMHAATQGHIRKRMAILIDGVVVTAPVVNEVLNESAVIEGHLTKQEAERIAAGMRIR